MNTIFRQYLLIFTMYFILQACSAAMAVTTNIAWQWVSAPFNNKINGSAYANGLYVAVGDEGDIWTSPTGIASWTKRYTFPAISDSSTAYKGLEAVCYAERKFVAVGGYANAAYTRTFSWVVTSTNGIAWEDQHITNFYKLFDVTFGTGKFVAVGGFFISNEFHGVFEQVIIASTNGARDWSAYPEITEHRQVRAVTYASNIFVAVGQAPTLNNATLWTMGAGDTNWIFRESNSDYAQLYDVIYAHNLFFAVGESACIFSTNGLSWTMPVADTGYPLPTAHFWLRAVTDFDGAFIGVGDYGNVQSTLDNGTYWSESYYPPGANNYANSLTDIIYTNDMLIAFGPTGKILAGEAVPEPMAVISWQLLGAVCWFFRRQYMSFAINNKC